MEVRPTMNRAWPIILALAALPLVAAAQTTQPARVRAEEAMDEPVVRPSLAGPLEDVLREVGELAGVEVVPDWLAIEATGAKRDTAVAVKASKATPGQLLDLALMQASQKARALAWYAEGAKVHVTTQMRVLYRGRLPARRPARGPRATTGPATRPSGLELRFEEARLEDVIDFFRNVSGVSFYVNWRALEAVGVTRDTPVTLRLRGVSIGRALDAVMDQLSGARGRMQRVYWVIDDGVVHVATGSALNQRTETRVYDVTDLLMVAPDASAPDLDLGERDEGDGGSSSGLFGEAEDGDDSDGTSTTALRQRRGEELVATIRGTIGEDMWRPIGKGSIRLHGNQLVVTQTPLGFKLLRDAVSPR
jgi:hypothetical protein